MSAEIVGLKLQAFFRLEGQRMLREAMPVSPGASKQEQIAGAAVALKLEFDFCLRVFKGRCGWRAFLTLHSHYRAWRDTQEGIAVADRLARLERQLADLGEQLSHLDRGDAPADRRAVRQPSAARATA